MTGPVVQMFAPARFGGLESVVVALASGLRRRGTEVMVGAVIEPDESAHPVLERLRARDVTVEPLPIPHRGYWREARAVRELLERVEPTVVHTHGYRCDVLAGLVARRMGCPVVSTVHGFTGGGWKNRLYERLQLWALRSHHAVVAVSRPLVGKLRSEGIPEARLHMVPNAWEPGGEVRSRAEARSRLDLSSDEVVLGWVGRLSEEKGPDVFLRALAVLGEDEAVVSIVGEGPKEAEVRRLARDLGLGGRVRFHGRVPEAARLYRAFDVFVLSSRTEGTPMVLFEAMASEVPIVATRVGGVPDVLPEDHGWLVPPEDPEALARGVGAVLADPEAARLRAARARRRVRERYAPGPWVERYTEIYSMAVAGEGRVSA